MCTRLAPRRANAFTMIELASVVLVLGTLLAVALPSYFSYARQAHDSAARQAVFAGHLLARFVYQPDDAYPDTATLILDLTNAPDTLTWRAEVGQTSVSTGPTDLAITVLSQQRLRICVWGA